MANERIHWVVRRIALALMLASSAIAWAQDAPASPQRDPQVRLGPPFHPGKNPELRRSLLEAWKAKRGQERGVVAPLGISPTTPAVGRASMVINSSGQVSYTKVFLPSGRTCDPNVEAINNWQADNSYVIGDVVAPTSAKGFKGFNFQATKAGLSGLSEPNWPASMGATINDNQVTWKAIGFDPHWLIGCTPMQLILRDVSATETIIAAEGDSFSGGLGLCGWGEFHAMNDSGVVAFKAAAAGILLAPPLGEDERGSAILTAGPGAGNIKKIAQTGDTIGGRTLCGLSPMVGINNAGQVLFDGLAGAAKGSCSCDCDENNHSLIRFTPGPTGNQVLIAQGSSIGGATVIGFGLDDNSGSSCVGCNYNNIDGFINASGHVPVVLNLSDGSQGVFILKAPGSFTQVARTGVGGITAIRPRVAINNSDQVSFIATSGGLESVFRFTPPSTLITIASVTDSLSGGMVAGFGPFTDINNLGNVVFEAIFAGNSEGYYFWDGSVSEVFLNAKGGLAAEMATVNDANLVAYVTGNRAPEGLPSDPNDASEMSQSGGLFLWTKAGGSVNSISVGDTIGGSPVQSVYSQHPSFARRQLSETGCVATEYAVTSDDPDLDNTEGAVLSPGGQLWVSCACQPITLSPSSLPGGTVGVPYNQTITASGGFPPFTFAVTSGSTPTNVNLASNGTLSGTPTATGTFNFDVTATDSNNCTGMQSYSVTIAPCTAPAAPTLTINPASANVGQTVKLSWNSTMTAGQGKYLVQRSTGGPFSTIATINATNAANMSFSFVASSPTGTQTYQVVAVPTCDSNLAATSNTVDLAVSGVITPPPCNAPPAPTGLHVSPSPVIPGQPFTLSWQAAPGADHYDVAISTDGGATVTSLGFVYGTSFSGTAPTTATGTIIFYVSSVANCGTAGANASVTVPVGQPCVAPGAVTNVTIQAFGVTPPRPPSPTEYILVSWTPSATGTKPTRYSVRINGDPEIFVVGTSVVLPPRGTSDPITAFVTAFGCASLTSAEIFDPAVGAWSVTGNLNLPRQEHTATLLGTGKVLVAGGVPTLFSLPSPTAELFDPASNQWTSTGALATPRDLHAAAGLGGSPGGTGTQTLSISQAGSQVLVEGGAGTSPLNSSEVYDSTAGSWSSVGALANARDLHTATVLPDGRVLVAGGLASGPLASAELYDPATKAWTATGSLAFARYRHTATLLGSGKVLVAGGFGAAGALASAEIFDPATGAWTATGSLATAREAHSAALLASGKVLVEGGDDGSSALASAELYDPTAGTWSSTGSLVAARRNHTSTLLAGGKVLVAGGFGADLTTSLKTAELYDPAVGTFSLTGALKGSHGVHSATLLASGKVLVAGAADKLGVELSGTTADSGPVALFLSPPVASFTISANPQVGAPVTFTDTSSPQATSWLWIFDEGAANDPDPTKRPTSTLQSPTHVYANAGTHQTTLVASNGAGSSNATQSFNVAAAAAGVNRVVESKTVPFDMQNPTRRRAPVELTGSNSAFLRLTSLESSETIIFLRFLDSGGRLVAERRLSVQPGSAAVYDLGAYGFTGRFSIELVSAQQFTSTLTVRGRSVREIHR